LSLATSTLNAANITQINRYATVSNKPLAAQINPLLSIQQIHFPQKITTVGQAIEWWLHYSGYSLAATNQQPNGLKAVMLQPLPQVHRNLGPLTVKEGLEVLAGQPIFMLTDDPLHRQVNFKLRPNVKLSVRSKA
jgi:type IV pili sensor histidine kinase/response regulator